MCHAAATSLLRSKKLYIETQKFVVCYELEQLLSSLVGGVLLVGSPCVCTASCCRRSTSLGSTCSEVAVALLATTTRYC